MESEIVLTIVSALATFLFGERLYTWFFVKEDKDGKKTDNFSKLIDAFNVSTDALQTQLKQSNEDSSQKQDVIVQLQKDLYNEREEKAVLKEELAVAKCRECQVHGCANREPQTGY